MADTDPAVILAAIRERNERYITTLALTEATAAEWPCGDVRLLLKAAEAVLKLADRLDSGREPYGHLVNRHEAATAFRRAIRAALAGEEAGNELADPAP